MRSMLRLWTDDSGATLVEYGVVLAVLVLVAVGMVRVFGLEVADLWGKIAASYP